MSATGTWNVTVKSPMGPQSGTMTVAVDGGTFTGTLTNPMGAMAVQDGRVDGDTLTWKMNLTAPMPLTLDATATVAGDTIFGTVKAGPFGAMELSGTRA